MCSKYKDTELIVRRATVEDMVAVSTMTQELADFQNLSGGVKVSVEELQRDGFKSEPPAFQCLIAEVSKGGGKATVGFALYYPTYSAWEGRTMMLQGLYVRASERRRGIGQQLFNAVAKETKDACCARLDFHVLEWNDARSFYDGYGAVNLNATEPWCCYRLAGAPLARAARLVAITPSLAYVAVDVTSTETCTRD